MTKIEKILSKLPTYTNEGGYGKEYIIELVTTMSVEFARYCSKHMWVIHGTEYWMQEGTVKVVDNTYLFNEFVQTLKKDGKSITKS